MSLNKKARVEMNAAELTRLYNYLSNDVTDLLKRVRVLEDNIAKLQLTINDMKSDIHQLQFSEANLIAAHTEAARKARCKV